MRSWSLAVFLCVLISVALLAAVFYVAVPVTNSAAQDSSRPSLSSILQAATVDCNSNEAPQCLDRLTPAVREVCLGCVNALTNEASSCDDFGDSFCTNLQNCPCGPCDHVLHAWVQCQVPECDNLCTMTTDSTDCLSGSVLDCFQQSEYVDINACSDCVYADGEERPEFFCPAYEPCQATCADCSEAVVEYFDCVFELDLPCDGVVDPMDYPELDTSCGQDYTQCFHEELLTADSVECINCINAAVLNAASIPDFCAADCPACGPCIDKVNLFVTCSVFASVSSSEEGCQENL